MSQHEPGHAAAEPKQHDFLNGIVHLFLDNNFSIILIVVSVLIGLAALLVTAREEDPQIVVPLADVMVSMPGPLGRGGRAARRPRRWRRCSTRSTASNTSTA